jgi:hypothetical protein
MQHLPFGVSWRLGLCLSVTSHHALLWPALCRKVRRQMAWLTLKYSEAESVPGKMLPDYNRFYFVHQSLRTGI